MRAARDFCLQDYRLPVGGIRPWARSRPAIDDGNKTRTLRWLCRWRMSGAMDDQKRKEAVLIALLILVTAAQIGMTLLSYFG